MYMTDSQQLNRQKQQNIKQCIIYITDNQQPRHTEQMLYKHEGDQSEKTNTHMYFFWYNLH